MPLNMLTASGLSVLLQGVLSIPVATSFDNNSFPTHGFVLLTETFGKGLSPDQARQNGRPKLAPNCLTLLW